MDEVLDGSMDGSMDLSDASRPTDDVVMCEKIFHP